VRGPRSFAEVQAVDPKLKQNVCHMLDLSIDRAYDGIVRVMTGAEMLRASAWQAVG